MTEPEILARAVAEDLGSDVRAALDNPPSGDAARSFAVPEAVAIAGFLLQCAQLSVQLWSVKREAPALVWEVLENPDLRLIAPGLDLEKRMDATGRLLAHQLPGSFGAYRPGLDRRASAEQRGWIAGLLKSRNEHVATTTRSFVGGPPLLVPFADQDYWALRKPIGWIPDATDGPDVIRVDVPEGFVTDLASIPRYLWPIMAKTGRYGNAAIYHDWLYTEQPCDRATADRVFDRALVEMGVDDSTRKIMWAAVRVFGGAGWKGHALDKAEGRKWVITKFPDDPRITWDDWRKRPDVFE